MEFTIERSELYKGLQRAQGVVSAKGAKPVLANVLIEADENGVTLFTTNLDIGLRGVYNSNVKTPGKATTQAKNFHDILRELADGEVTIKVDDDGRLRIFSGKSKFTLATIPAVEFPAFPGYDESKLVNLDSAMVSTMIKKTSYAISQDETRLTLNGAFFEISPEKVRMVATDGHRLALIERDGAFKVEETIKSIISRKAVQELAKLLGEGDEPLKYMKQDNHMMFQKTNLTMVVRLIDGAFPNYEQVIPKSHSCEGTLNSDQFSHALRRVSILADEKSRMVKLSFEQSTLSLTSEGGELGDAKDEMEAEFSGEKLDIGLNALYLIDAVNAIDNEIVTVKMHDSLSPLVMQSPEDPGVLSIIMPMRL